MLGDGTLAVLALVAARRPCCRDRAAPEAALPPGPSRVPGGP